ncbi:MAG: DUF4377 domain-containing protein [Chloroflexota bacterium]
MIRILAILTILLLTATVASAQNDDAETVILHVGPNTQSCVGVGPQDCLIVRFDDEDDLTFFYDNIEGFEFEQGFEYTLEVVVTEIDNPPADASSLQYELVEIVQQYPASLEGKVWELQSLYGDEIDDPTRYQFTIGFEESFLKADCNNVGTIITQDPFNIETTVSTQVFCGEDSRDVDYIFAINDASMMSIENGELILQSPEGQLRFAPPSIEDIEWRVETVGSIASIIMLDESTPYTLSIEDDVASMTLVCNQAGADVTFNGAVMTFGEVETEEELCESNPLEGQFPPEEAVYYITPDGQLGLSDQNSTFYTLVNPDSSADE